MKRDRKINTQGTGKEEDRVDNIRPDQGETAPTDDMTDAGVSAQVQGEANNEGNQVTADIAVGEADRGNTDTFNNNNTTNNYAQEVDVNTGGVALEKSPGATNKGNNPSNADLATTPSDDREAISRSVDEDAEKQTGRPTGAIYGSGDEIIAVKGTASKKSTTPKSTAATSSKKATPKQKASITRMYGQILADDNSFFIEQGNVPEGKLQLVAPKEIMDRMADYNGQFVSIEGELSKKNKSDKYATFSIYKIVSHEQIGRRAYELSHENPSSEEDNWMKAENELLQQ